MKRAPTKVPIGIDDFGELRNNGYYYVDKSELISDIVSQGSKVYLFTRPRRFGKSLNLSMIDAFFDIGYKNNTWFDGLSVMEHSEAVAEMNKYPVVRLDMKDLPVDSGKRFRAKLALRMSELYISFDYLKDSKKWLKKIRNVI